MTHPVTEAQFRAAYARCPNDVELSKALSMDKSTVLFRRRRYGLPALVGRGNYSKCAAVLIALSTPAAAQGALPCTQVVNAEANIKGQYGELRVWSGTEPGREVRLYMNPSTGTWTVLIVVGDKACVSAVGTDAALGDGPLPGDPA